VASEVKIYLIWNICIENKVFSDNMMTLSLVAKNFFSVTRLHSDNNNNSKIIVIKMIMIFAQRGRGAELGTTENKSR